ncbi:MAG: hypothetical protein AAFN10_20580 [Bacteroidota bacterium]
MSFLVLALLTSSCTPDPIPDLQAQLHGRWYLRVNGHARYSPIFGYSFHHPISDPFPRWTIDFAADGTAVFETDSSYQTTWQHIDRDNIEIRIPSGIFLPELGSWDCKFLKYQNEYKQQYFMGGGTYFTDTAVVRHIDIEMFWDLERVP